MMNTLPIKTTTSTLFAGLVGLGTAVAGPISVDSDLPTYSKTSGVSGNLNSIGSDTLNNLMTLWAESFQAIYPNVNVQIEGKGSSTSARPDEPGYEAGRDRPF